MKIILILSSFLVYAQALPTYDTDKIDRTDPEGYKNIEILILESAVDQDGGYSYSFENDDGSRGSQEGEHKIVDEDHAIESIRGSYSYTDVNGQPVSITYTADENGFRPVGAHLPTPPPIPPEIAKSLRFLATAKPFVDDQWYDYKPKKKVYRGRQYNSVTRKNDRSNTLPAPIVENIPDEVEAPDDIQTKTTQESLDKVYKQTSAARSTWDVVNDSKKNIENALKESIEKTSKITLASTNANSASSISAIRDEAAKITDQVKSEVNKITQATGARTQQVPEPSIQQIPEPNDEHISEKLQRILSDVVSSTDEVFIETDVGTTDDSQIDLNVELGIYNGH